MDKRAAKRFKRQVTRAKAHVKLSEPDVRTPEQIREDREKGHASFNRGNFAQGPNVAVSTHGVQHAAGGGPVKVDTGS